MTLRYALVFWTKSKKISVVAEGSFVKTSSENGEEIPLCEGAVRMITIGEKQFEAKILRICSSKKYLESLVVTKDGEIVLIGAKPPAKELLAKKRNLSTEEADDLNSDRSILRPINGTGEEQSSKPHASSDCSHGCPSCCSGTLPPFPELPHGFVTTLVSLAEYFQQFQKITADKVTPQALAQAQADMSKNLNTWQWASREKVELKKGTGVWIDSMKLEKIMGHCDMTKKPPHQTLVKSLLLDLLGLDKYIEISAEKIDRRLLSAVVGFTNEKYPELAQPVERYYRCINLNRGYMLKRKNEGVGVSYNDESQEITTKSRRSKRQSREEDQVDYRQEHRSRRPRKSSGVNRETSASTETNTFSNTENSDQLIIPLDCDNEDFSSMSNDSLNKIIVVPSKTNAVKNSEPSQKNAVQATSQSTISLRERRNIRPPAALTEVYDIDSDDDDDDFSSSNNGVHVKVEDDIGFIEGALDFES